VFTITGYVTVESHPLPDSASFRFLSCVVSKCILRNINMYLAVGCSVSVDIG